MSKAQKLRQRLLSVPADFTWDELVTLLKGLDFKEISDTGSSRRCFIKHATGQKIFLHEPHPKNIVKRYALREVITKLAEFGINIKD